MSVFIVLCISFVVLPLVGTIVIDPIVSIRDIWTAKEFLALLFILGISILTFIRGPAHRPAINKPLCCLLFFLPISAFCAPPIMLEYGHANLGGLWIWKATAWAFAYFLFYHSITSITIIQEKQRRALALCVAVPVVISSFYAFFQAFGIDQWQLTKSVDQIGLPEAPGVSGMIGNPMYLGIYLVICLPFAMAYLRKRWAAVIIVAAVLCKSDIALAGIGLTLCVFFAMRAKSTVWLKAGVVLVLAVILTLWAFWGDIRPMIHDSGRFAVWAQTVDDWKGGCIKMAIPEGASMAQKKEIENLNKRNYAMTGRGLGSFQFIFGPKYNSVFDSAHSVYLDALYEIGLIGIGILLAAIGFVIKNTFAIAREDKFARALFVSFVFILFAGCFASILRIEPLRYFTIAIFCLLSSLIVDKKTVNIPE